MILDAASLQRVKDAAEKVLPFREGEDFDAYWSRALGVLTKGQLAWLAAVVIEENDRLRKEYQKRKSDWIAAARAEFRPGSQQPCFVCGKYRDLAQAHHVVPLTAQFDRQFKRADSEHEWLCPNHHQIIHSIIPPEKEVDPSVIGRRAAGSLADCSRDEVEKLLELVSRSGRWPE